MEHPRGRSEFDTNDMQTIELSEITNPISHKNLLAIPTRSNAGSMCATWNQHVSDLKSFEASSHSSSNTFVKLQREMRENNEGASSKPAIPAVTMNYKNNVVLDASTLTLSCPSLSYNLGRLPASLPLTNNFFYNNCRNLVSFESSSYNSDVIKPPQLSTPTMTTPSLESSKIANKEAKVAMPLKSEPNDIINNVTNDDWLIKPLPYENTADYNVNNKRIHGNTKLLKTS